MFNSGRCGALILGQIDLTAEIIVCWSISPYREINLEINFKCNRAGNFKEYTLRLSDFRLSTSVDTILILAEFALIWCKPDITANAYEATYRFDRVHQG